MTIKLKSLSNLTFFIAFLFVGCAWGDGLIIERQERVRSLKLYEDRAWLSLLYYHRSINGKYVSQADDPSFFLGDRTPESELSELLKHINAKPRQDSPICRFPARANWVVQRLNLPVIDFSQCENYIAWRQKYPVEAAYVVFASFSAKSPSSLLGHTFLKFSSESSSPLLDQGANFVADTNSSKNNLDYLFRGIFGGFPGVLNDEQYFHLKRRYLVNEGRDLWHYKLNLSQEEVVRVVDHLWEIKDGVFDYYFFSENCSYRVLAILSTVRDVNVKKYNHRSVPLDTIRELDNLGLISSSEAELSSKKNFTFDTLSLTKEEKIVVKKIALGERAVSTIYSHANKDKLLLLSYRYLSILIESGRVRGRKYQAIIYELLRNLAESDFNYSKSSAKNRAKNPLESHKFERLSMFAGKDTDDYLGLSYRLAGHSIDDNYSNTLADVEAEYLNVVSKIYKSSILLERLDLVRLYSTPNYTYFFPKKSWGMELGFAQEYNEKKERYGSLNVNYYQGITVERMNHKIKLFSSVTAQFSEEYDGLIGVAANFSIKSQSSSFNYFYSYEYVDILNDDISKSMHELKFYWIQSENFKSYLSGKSRNISGVNVQDNSIGFYWYF